MNFHSSSPIPIDPVLLELDALRGFTVTPADEVVHPRYPTPYGHWYPVVYGPVVYSQDPYAPSFYVEAPYYGLPYYGVPEAPTTILTAEKKEESMEQVSPRRPKEPSNKAKSKRSSKMTPETPKLQVPGHQIPIHCPKPIAPGRLESFLRSQELEEKKQKRIWEDDDEDKENRLDSRIKIRRNA